MNRKENKLPDLVVEDSDTTVNVQTRPIQDNAGIQTPTTIMSDGETACTNSSACKNPHTTVAVPVSVIPLLVHALTKIRSTPPRVIASPPTQPRRAAVALVIRVSPPRNFPQILPRQAQPSLQEFFQLDWVNVPGAVAEILFLKRENPGEDAAFIANNRVNGSPEAHVAFPGGKTEEGDEGSCYTGAQLCVLKYPHGN